MYFLEQNLLCCVYVNISSGFQLIPVRFSTNGFAESLEGSIVYYYVLDK